MTTAIEVVDIKTGQVVHSVDVRTCTERTIEQTMRGMLRNLNQEEFLLREKEGK